MIIYPTSMIADNLRAVTGRIARCCEKIGKASDSVKLVVVTKEALAPEIEEAIAAGAKILGENRIRDVVLKYRAIGDRPEWHLIGHLQTNKVKDAVKIFSLIHSVDTIKLAKAIDKEAARIGKCQRILIQVNVSGEESKFGISAGETIDFLREVSEYRNISIEGLMTIAPETEDPQGARPYFSALRELLAKTSEALTIPVRYPGAEYSILSMGMTGDFEVAIEEGSNMVRIGRAIYDR